MEAFCLGHFGSLIFCFVLYDGLEKNSRNILAYPSLVGCLGKVPLFAFDYYLFYLFYQSRFADVIHKHDLAVACFV